VPKISKSIRVERSLEDLADLFGSRPPEWLVRFASIAVHTAEAAGARRAGALIAGGPRRVRRIAIDLSDVPQVDDASRIDAGVRWETSGFRWAFSSFEGRVVARRESSEVCTLALEGTYAKPTSAGDRDAVSAAADAALSMLLTTLRDAVEEQARAGV